MRTPYFSLSSASWTRPGLMALLTAVLVVSVLSTEPVDAKKKKKKSNDPVVTVETDKGTFRIRVFKDDVPITANNFLSLVNQGFYNGLVFHRYEPGFCIQGGDPTGTGAGGSGKKIPLEISKKLRHNEAGMVGMARKGSDKNSATSQFYVLLNPASNLNDKYCIFGKVVEGMETVITLRKGDKMTKLFVDTSKKKKRR